MTREIQFEPGDALMIIDVQNDFVPGGALAVPEGDQVIPVLNTWIAAAEDAGVPILFTRDWHPEDHISFQARGGPWPPHCVRHTPGAELHPGLRMPKTYILHDKARDSDREEYSDFGGSDLARWLRNVGIRRLWIGGLALDYCVHASTLDALQEGFAAHVILAATRAITPETGKKAVAELGEAGAVLEEGELRPRAVEV